MIPLPRDFQDFLKLLNAGRIRYVVIGGYALAYHGYVRYTGDLDIFAQEQARQRQAKRPGRCRSPDREGCPDRAPPLI
jgi:hypothetical protein